MGNKKLEFEGKEIDVNSLSNDELVELYHTIVERRKEIDKKIKEHKEKEMPR